MLFFLWLRKSKPHLLILPHFSVLWPFAPWGGHKKVVGYYIYLKFSFTFVKSLQNYHYAKHYENENYTWPIYPICIIDFCVEQPHRRSIIALRVISST